MRIKILFLAIVICCLTFKLLGQSNYYSTEDKMFFGASLIKGSEIQNAMFCQVRKENEILKFFPNDIKEFGFKDGTVYISKEINISNSIKQVFLERLVRGTVNLYYYKDKNVKTYFIEKPDGTTKELPRFSFENDKIKFNTILSDLTSDCKNTFEATKLVSYKKKSLSEFIKLYNSCDSKPFPFFKYGFIIGYGLTKYSRTNYLPSYLYFSVFDFRYNGSLSVGLFIDKPIFARNLSLHVETSLTSNVVSDHQTINDTRYDLVLKTSSLSIPFLVRYTYPSLRNRPYINIGPIYTYNFNNSNTLHETKPGKFTDLSNWYKIVPNNLFGFSIGAGIQKRITYRNNIFFELRFNKLYGPSSFEFLNKGEFNLLTGINF